MTTEKTHDEIIEGSLIDFWEAYCAKHQLKCVSADEFEQANPDADIEHSRVAETYARLWDCTVGA
jgi:hypothetical protein